MSKRGALTLQSPSNGWQQFLNNRTEMLAAFDAARTKARKQKVETFHGRVAEAELRKWLKSFLPKRYDVTSGYVISLGIPDAEKASHFDVIIYDHLDAPILWVEDSPDNSDGGTSKAIPVEYVRAVIEVKSSFSTKTIRESIDHLGDLKKLMNGSDPPEERYKLYLPSNFFCSVFFFELREVDAGDNKALDYFLEARKRLRGFHGGLILRSFNQAQASGKIRLFGFDRSMESIESATFADRLSIRQEKLNEKIYLTAHLQWEGDSFANYAFDLVAQLNGTYQVGMASSFYGGGASLVDNSKRAGEMS